MAQLGELGVVLSSAVGFALDFAQGCHVFPGKWVKGLEVCKNTCVNIYLFPKVLAYCILFFFKNSEF